MTRLPSKFSLLRDVYRRSCEGSDNAMVSLTRQLSVAGFPEGSSRASRSIAKQLIEACSGHQEQSVGRPGAGNGKSPECRIEFVELRGTGERMDSDGEKICLSLI